MSGGVSKLVLNSVTSFIDNPFANPMLIDDLDRKYLSYSLSRSPDEFFTPYHLVITYILASNPSQWGKGCENVHLSQNI